jgi:formylglycine-generating enzyme required for sulfatase activity
MHMHGNVWEWCENKYKQSDNHRVMRGGSWSSSAWYCRTAHRIRVAPGYRHFINFGLRLCFRLD